MSRSTATRLQVSDADLLKPFASAHLDPVKAGPLDKLSLAWVGLMVLLLPVIYIGLILLALYGTLYHATHTGWISDLSNGNTKLFLLLYLLPLIAGLVLVCFMTKPLIPTRLRRSKPMPLDPAREPLLFEFVGQLAQALHVPTPTRICADTDIEANADFRRGGMSFLSNELVLVIGIPLLANLSTRQLAGVLAHELGQFAPAANPRLRCLIVEIMAWLARAVSDRDSWGAWFTKPSGRSMWVLQLPARAAVVLTRAAMWVLLCIGSLVSCAALRRRTYQVDRLEAGIAGPDSLATRLQQMALLKAGQRAAMEKLGEAMGNHQLVDDVPALIQAQLDQMSSTLREDILHAQSEQATSLLDVEPCYSDRVQAVSGLPKQAIYPTDIPARQLLRQFDELGPAVTKHYYENVLNKEDAKLPVVTVDDLIRQEQQSQQEIQKAQRYFLGLFSGNCPLRLEQLPRKISGDAQPCIDALIQARAQMAARLETAQPLLEQYVQADVTLLDVTSNLALLEGGFRKVAGPDGDMKDQAEHAALASQLAAEKERLLPLTAQYQQLVQQRLLAGLSLLESEHVAADVPDVEALRATCRRCLAMLHTYTRVFPIMTRMRDAFSQATALADNLDHSDDPAKATTALKQRYQTLRDVLTSLRQDLAGTQYPFDHAAGKMAMSDYTVETIPQEGRLLVQQAMLASGRLVDVYFRCVGTLTGAAEQVEDALGLERFPDPPEE